MSLSVSFLLSTALLLAPSARAFFPGPCSAEALTKARQPLIDRPSDTA
jgi:hypothetical protein